MVITGAVVEHVEDVTYVTLYTRTGWVVWLCNPDTGARTIVEHVEVGP